MKCSSPGTSAAPFEDPDFVQSVEVQTDYERGRMDGIAHMRGLADDVLARALADELEIEALKARVEDFRRRLAAGVAQTSVRDALDNSQSLLAMIFQLNTSGSVSEHDWETEGLSDLITKQIAENRGALSPDSSTDKASLDLCAGGVDPGWDACPKCGATMDDECAMSLQHQREGQS